MRGIMSRRRCLYILIFLTLTYALVFTTISSRKRYYPTRQPPPAYLNPSKSYLQHSNSTGNAPDIYFIEKSKKPSSINKTCAKFPALFDLRFKNNYWQIQKISTGILYLFNAYLDNRGGRNVRILTMYDRKPSNVTFYCQLWYNNTKPPVIVQTEALFYLWRAEWGPKSDNYFIHPYLVTCPLPPTNADTPVSVSLVDFQCTNATNNLKIFHQEGPQQNFVVCVKGLAFPYEDNSIRLAEWIELLGLLGVEKINFYELNVHPKTQKILDYYVRQQKIEVTPLTLVGDVSNVPYLQQEYLHNKNLERRLQEVIPYNDCLYKHLQVFKYIVLLDIDEIIVPVEGTWVDLLSTLQQIKPDKVSYLARNVYFLDVHQHQHDFFGGIPRYMHMLQHVYRAKNYSNPGYYVKGFHDLDHVLGLHNHYPYKCIDRCTDAEIDISLAQLQHYREDCARGLSSCEDMRNNSVTDNRVWRFKDELIQRVQTALKAIDWPYR